MFYSIKEKIDRLIWEGHIELQMIICSPSDNIPLKAWKKIVEIYNQYKIWTWSDFINLRNLVVRRLTMCNGRLGQEACRLLRSEFKDAVEDNLFNKRWKKDPYVLSQELKIAYEAGKGMNKLVPVLFTVETLAATILLDDDDLRH